MKAWIPILAMIFIGPTNAEDMQKYLTQTQALAADGKHEEALKRFIWFHENALEHDESMYGVRLSFALSYWKMLGESYPPALKALVNMRDDDVKILREGKGDKNLFHDVIALNRTLEEPEKTVTLFELMSEKEPAQAEEYWRLAKDQILEQKRYDLARKYIKNVETEFTDIKETYDHNLTLYENPQIGGAQFKLYNENNFVDEVQKLVLLALAISSKDAAIRIRDSALAVIDDKRLKSLIPE